MVFQDLLDQKQAAIAPGFERLVNDALSNQSHPGDFLLVCCNGAFDPEVSNFQADEPMSPYKIGGGAEELSAGLHYKFIDNYMRSSVYRESYTSYQKEIKRKPDTSAEEEGKLTKLLYDEEIILQLEMLIYLKIWEADSFIKRLYQITRLAFGEPYDWHFKIEETGRSKGEKYTGSRQDIIRKKVRDRLQNKYTEVYFSIKKAYVTQIRHSIAHSNYSFLDRHLHPNNYVKEDQALQLQFLTFDDWTKMFHESIVLYTLLVEGSRMVHRLYVDRVMKSGGTAEIRVSRKYPKEGTEFRELIYLPETNRWNFKSNEE